MSENNNKIKTRERQRGATLVEYLFLMTLFVFGLFPSFARFVLHVAEYSDERLALVTSSSPDNPSGSGVNSNSNGNFGGGSGGTGPQRCKFLGVYATVLEECRLPPTFR